MTIFKIKCKSAYADLSFHIEYIQLFYLKSELQLIFFSDLYPYISQMETTKIDIFYKKKKKQIDWFHCSMLPQFNQNIHVSN